MQINYTLPAHNLDVLQTKRASLQRKGCLPLKPVSTTSAQSAEPNSSSLSTKKAKTHLAKLEKLLQIETPRNGRELSPVLQESSSESRGRGILDGLNLSSVWPAERMSGAEEMSPRHLKSLQRLLSVSPEHSPRNQLGRRWREYHGSNDWAGLLDPLDENLRRELVRYGEFVQAAYQTFHSHPATSSERVNSQYDTVPLPDPSYRVTKSLYATSSLGLPTWIDDLAPDLAWMTQQSSWIGYVAVCDDKQEIARMGRRDIVIALRGTATCLEWAENLRDLLVEIPKDGDVPHRRPKVECGFLSLFATNGKNVPSLMKSIIQEVQRLRDFYRGETLSITITGHSLGAALALLAAHEVSSCDQGESHPVAVFSFGGPRVGNRAFADRLAEKNVKVLRIVNAQDVITRVPGMFVSEDIDRKLRRTCVAEVLDVLDNIMPWAYAHAGTELTVDTKMSPYLKPNADVACCHDLEAYLHLVDGFLASDSPFRANAKRSLSKLLSEQGANVKKLYISKAKSLTSNFERDREVNPMPSCMQTHELTK
ncbi:hypothetical protein Nepgr_024641 [Nepenthes gracilis]|uniref:Fungal lipase-type domain-containing protein n=1 Tax=Nepenthes gracilis TaxID=150966 RepID=A0AAD3XYZ9_NEPGR|nr:hypothetical protein Nepgr_024641 [Nepenthes gracilis]